MIIFVLSIIAGLILLIFGSERFIEGAARLSLKLQVPPLIIGLVVVGMATSAPELLVSVVAAVRDSTCIAIGNAVGSNIANIGMVLGACILLVPVSIRSRFLRREYGWMLFSVLLLSLLMLDTAINRSEGSFLLVILVAIITALTYGRKRVSQTDALAVETDIKIDEQSTDNTILGAAALTGMGLLVLLVGSELLIRGAIAMARYFLVSDLVIGLTIVAVGTSLPELATCLVSLKKKQADIAIGNILGSNMFNSLAVVGLPALIAPASCAVKLVYRDFPVMIFLSLLLGALLFIRKKAIFPRIAGILLLSCFIGYQYLLYIEFRGI